MTTVVLTWDEVHMAGQAAAKRALDNIKAGRIDRYGAEGLGADYHLKGCLGEMAVAKYRGIYWRPHEFGITDVGHIQVRATGYYPKGKLCLHEDDKDEQPFVSAVVIASKLPKICLQGWIWAGDGKKQEWWGEVNPAKPNGRPAYWVPVDDLLPMRELP